MRPPRDKQGTKREGGVTSTQGPESEKKLEPQWAHLWKAGATRQTHGCTLPSPTSVSHWPEAGLGNEPPADEPSARRRTGERDKE